MGDCVIGSLSRWGIESLGRWVIESLKPVKGKRYKARISAWPKVETKLIVRGPQLIGHAG